MTINDYLQNPYGKGSAVSNVTKMKEDMLKEYNELINRFACRIYRYRDEAIFHVIVPSKSRPNVSYDVVIETRMNEVKETDPTVNNVEMKVFSNCPSFIYTFAHTFIEKGFMIKWLEKKYRPEVKKKIPNAKNEYGIVGMERSLYLACLFLTKTHKSDLSTINTIGIKPSGYNAIVNVVRNQDQIMESVRAKIKPEDPKAPTGSPSQPLYNKKRTAIQEDRRVPKTVTTKKTGTTTAKTRTTQKMADGLNKTKKTPKI